MTDFLVIVTKCQFNLHMEITEHIVWSFTTEFVPLAKKDLNKFPVQKSEGAYSLFGDVFLSFQCKYCWQKVRCNWLVASRVWVVLGIDAI